MQRVKAIILGGGRGTRLQPLTDERAKPAVGFAGKYRLIDIPISNCINSDIKRIYVLTQFLSASLHRHIMQAYQFDTFSNGVIEMLPAEQTHYRDGWFQGTADAVRATLHHTTYYKTDQALILSGDHLYRMDYRELIAYHRAKNADITIAVYPIPQNEASAFGLMRAAPDGVVKDFVEKPTDKDILDRFVASPKFFKSLRPTIDTEFLDTDAKVVTPDEIGNNDANMEDGGCCLASMGIYLFSTRVLQDILSSCEGADFGREIIPEALKRYRVYAWPFRGYWKDIGTISAFYEANISLAQRQPDFSLYAADWPFYTRERSLPPCRVVGSKIKDCLLVEGSNIVGAQAEDSIIGARSMVREGTYLNGVVMHGSDYYDGESVLGGDMQAAGNDIPGLGVGQNCHIERTIIDKNARIGDNVIIDAHPDVEEYKGQYHWIRNGINIIPKGTIIPSGTKI